MAMKMGMDMAKAFLAATGIPEKMVIGVELHMEQDEIAHITVSRALDSDALSKLSKELQALAEQQGAAK